MLEFILADLRRNWIGAAALALLVALSTALSVAVILEERALRLGSARAAAPFDLVIGAPGSETQLVLSSIFLQPAPLPLLKDDILARLQADPRVAMAVPVGFGDSVGPFPVVGTLPEAIAMLGGLGEGKGFERPHSAIAGSAVTYPLGTTFQPNHGSPGQASAVHEDVLYRIEGRLAPTGTAWDRAILVPIESVWETHVHHDEGNEHGDGPHGLPAIIVKPGTIADAYQLRQEYRTDETLAVFPGEVLTRLYGTLGDVRGILVAMSIGTQIIVGAAILMIVAVHVLQRRRQIGALRAFGASRPIIFAIVWTEVTLVLGAGVLFGHGLGYFAAEFISDHLSNTAGISLPVEFRREDLLGLAATFLIAALATLLPAWAGCRQSPAEALRA
ncbi:FtsX-like permease family protein [Chelativorans composti]|jgi:ABC-type transport system, involved in lipoprotein release, permease component|uniref:ABC transporter permease n=1 Tax=Chelativorans composti TaxID=768533 RepID=A0ABW5DDL5_9HYPH